MPQKRPRSRFTLDYNVNDRVQLGFEYNTLVGEIGFRGSYVVQSGEGGRAQIHLNTSSDRIGTPEGYQQLSLTVAKPIKGLPIAPYASLTYSGFDKKLVFPFGASLQIDKNWSAIFMNDGRKSHALLTYSAKDFYVQAGWIWFKHPSITIGWGF